MARIRTIKPEFWQDEGLAEISETAMLLAIGLLNHADDEGYFRANIGLVKAAVFPIREPSVSIHGALHELSNEGYLELCTGSDGRNYGRIKSFREHQVISRPTESKIKGLWALTESSLSPQGELHRERKGKEGIKEKGTNVPKKKASRKVATLVPALWVPDTALADWFAEQGFEFNIADMTRQFIDGCHAKGLKYVDHRAAFRNWSKNRHERQQTQTGGHARRKSAAEVCREVENEFAEYAMQDPEFAATVVADSGVNGGAVSQDEAEVHPQVDKRPVDP